jgi:hypothetical protein
MVREVTIAISESLASEAEASGILRGEVLERLIRDEIRRRRSDGLFAAADRLAELPGGAMTDEELQSEIEAARAQRRENNARRP